MNQDLPHILFLFPDQLRADFLSAAGHPVSCTPNIDRLAREGNLDRLSDVERRFIAEPSP